MDTDTDLPLADAGVGEEVVSSYAPDTPAVVEEAPVVTAPAASEVQPEPSTGHFVSLYDNASTAILAVVLGIVIVGGVQWIGALSFRGEGGEHRALTRFVTAMVAIMVGVYVSDMLIAGPNAMLLAESERLAILSFVKDTALMIFAFYFGTKTAASPPSSET